LSFLKLRRALEEKELELRLKALEDLQGRILACNLCPRLREFDVRVGLNPPRRFRGQAYWSRPVPSLGDPLAPIVIVGRLGSCTFSEPFPQPPPEGS